MKKAASLLLTITLITSLFYNLVGYYMIVSYQKEQSWITSMQNAPDSKFRIIKLNATLYSFMEDTDIEKVNENVVIDNKIYHIFKKSIKDNVLNLYYLGVENQTAIDVSLKKLVDAQKDAGTSNSPLEKLLKSFNKDYLSHFYTKITFVESLFFTIKPIFKNDGTRILSGFIMLNYPPPKVV
jgi:hypothetical protein